MKNILAIWANLGWRAFQVLGPVQYLRFLVLFFLNLPVIISRRVLTTVDKGMGTKPLRINYRGTRFIFDCKYCDQKIKDGSYSFGIVREIYLRDCYFRHHDPSVFSTSRTVLDLGANRGSFSVLMATHADQVICVDVVPDFADIIRQNMKINGFQNYVFDCALIGDGGSYAGPVKSITTIEEILHRHHMLSVDFLKMDLEGSEFALFRSPSWLQCVKHLSMEVHPDYGDVQVILDTLKDFGFTYVVTDHLFRPTVQLGKISYIYASKVVGVEHYS